MKRGRTLCQVFTEELWTMSADDYDEAMNWFDWWLAVQRNGYTPRSQEMCDACQRHNAWMAERGGIEHSALWTGGDEAVAVVTAGAPLATAQSIAELWSGSEKHTNIVRKWGAHYGFAMYWHNDRVFATFRSS